MSKQFFKILRAKSYLLKVPQTIKGDTLHVQGGVVELVKLANRQSLSIQGQFYEEGLQEIQEKIDKILEGFRTILEVKSGSLEVESLVYLERKSQDLNKIDFGDIFSDKKLSKKSEIFENPLKSNRNSTIKQEDDLLNFSNIGANLLEVTDLNIDVLPSDDKGLLSPSPQNQPQSQLLFLKQDGRPHPTENRRSIQDAISGRNRNRDRKEGHIDDDLLNSFTFDEIKASNDCSKQTIPLPQSSYDLRNSKFLNFSGRTSKNNSRETSLGRKRSPNDTSTKNYREREKESNYSKSPAPNFGRAGSSKKRKSTSKRKSFGRHTPTIPPRSPLFYTPSSHQNLAQQSMTAHTQTFTKSRKGNNSSSHKDPLKLLEGVNKTMSIRPRTVNHLEGDLFQSKSPPPSHHKKSQNLQRSRIAASSSRKRKQPMVSPSPNQRRRPISTKKLGQKSGQVSKGGAVKGILMSKKAIALMKRIPSRETIQTRFHPLLIQLIDGVGKQFDFSDSSKKKKSKNFVNFFRDGRSRSPLLKPLYPQFVDY